MKKKLKTIVLLIGMICLMGNTAFAASDSTRNASGSSYTRWIGPATKSQYCFSIDGKKYSGTKKNCIEYKDPYVSHVGLAMYLKYGEIRKGSYYNGSASAYHRGKVENGYVKITA